MTQDIVNENQKLSYTNLDFASIYVEVLDMIKQLTKDWDPSISDESDPGVILVKLSALLADKCNYNIDKSILEAFPLSVTQESNARQLYEQLGYYMGWYKAAKTDVSIAWKSATQIIDGAPLVYTIPKFASITDDNSNVVYTLVGTEGESGIVVSDGTLVCDASKQTSMVAYEGIPTQFTFNDKTLITPNAVDMNNRLYLSTPYVFENGIFINNFEQTNFAEWKKVDNLYESSYNIKRYKFGYDSKADLCYIEFPDNYAELFGAGIEIVYLSFSNTESYSDVPAGYLTKFLSYITPVEDASTALGSSDVLITNPVAASGHAEKESINEAYTNYKKTVATFNTLITLRDYANYIRSNELDVCSNAVVADRTNDIQSSYKIVSKKHGVESIGIQVEETKEDFKLIKTSDVDINLNKQYFTKTDTGYLKVETPVLSDLHLYYELDGEDILTPFSLKFYLLQKAVAVNSRVGFESTFEMTSDLIDMDSILEDTSHLVHTFKDIDSFEMPTIDYVNQVFSEPDLSKIVFIKNKYPINMNIRTYNSASLAVRSDIISNIVKAFYNGLGSNNLEFGKEISLEYLSNLARESDSRIKEVIFDNIEYESYATFYNEETESFAEIKLDKSISELATPEIISEESAYLGVTSSDYDPYSKEPIFEPVFEAYTNGENIEEYGYKLLEDSDFRKTTNYMIIDTDFSGVAKKYYTKTTDNTYVQVVNPTVEDIANYYVKLKWFVKIEDGEVIEDAARYKLIQYNVIDNVDSDYLLPQGNPFRYYILSTNEVKATVEKCLRYIIGKDIVCKSILAGTTKLLVEDSIFDYNLNQKYIDTQNEVKYIDAKAVIDMNTTGNFYTISNSDTTPTISKTYTLKDNELLTLYRPSLSNSNVSYTAGVHYECIVGKDIDVNESYMLKNGEYLITYIQNLDDTGTIKSFSVTIYFEGKIISPSFKLQKNPIDKASSYARTAISRLDATANTYKTDSTFAYDENNSNYITQINNDTIISNTKIDTNDTINIQSLNRFTISSGEGYRFIWSLKNVSSRTSDNVEQYELFGKYDSKEDIENYDKINTYTLKNGEFLYYIDSNLSKIGILGAGTTIQRNCGISVIPELAIDEDPLVYVNVEELYKSNLVNLDFIIGQVNQLKDTSIIKNVGENDITKIDIAKDNYINPKLNGFYELNNGNYVRTEDTVWGIKYTNSKITSFVSPDLNLDGTPTIKTYYIAVPKDISGYYTENSVYPIKENNQDLFKKVDTSQDNLLADVNPSEVGYYEKVLHSDNSEVVDSLQLASKNCESSLDYLNGYRQNTVRNNTRFVLSDKTSLLTSEIYRGLTTSGKEKVIDSEIESTFAPGINITEDNVQLFVANNFVQVAVDDETGKRSIIHPDYSSKDHLILEQVPYDKLYYENEDERENLNDSRHFYVDKLGNGEGINYYTGVYNYDPSPETPYKPLSNDIFSNICDEYTKANLQGGIFDSASEIDKKVSLDALSVVSDLAGFTYTSEIDDMVSRFKVHSLVSGDTERWGESNVIPENTYIKLTDNDINEIETFTFSGDYSYNDNIIIGAVADEFTSTDTEWISGKPYIYYDNAADNTNIEKTITKEELLSNKNDYINNGWYNLSSAEYYSKDIDYYIFDGTNYVPTVINDKLLSFENINLPSAESIEEIEQYLTNTIYVDESGSEKSGIKDLVTPYGDDNNFSTYIYMKNSDDTYKAVLSVTKIVDGDGSIRYDLSPVDSSEDTYNYTEEFSGKYQIVESDDAMPEQFYYSETGTNKDKIFKDNTGKYYYSANEKFGNALAVKEFKEYEEDVITDTTQEPTSDNTENYPATTKVNLSKEKIKFVENYGTSSTTLSDRATHEDHLASYLISPSNGMLVVNNAIAFIKFNTTKPEKGNKDNRGMDLFWLPNGTTGKDSFYANARYYQKLTSGINTSVVGNPKSINSVSSGTYVKISDIDTSAEKLASTMKHTNVIIANGYAIDPISPPEKIEYKDSSNKTQKIGGDGSVLVGAFVPVIEGEKVDKDQRYFRGPVFNTTKHYVQLILSGSSKNTVDITGTVINENTVTSVTQGGKQIYKLLDLRNYLIYRKQHVSVLSSDTKVIYHSFLKQTESYFKNNLKCKLRYSRPSTDLGWEDFSTVTSNTLKLNDYKLSSLNKYDFSTNFGESGIFYYQQKRDADKLPTGEYFAVTSLKSPLEINSGVDSNRYISEKENSFDCFLKITEDIYYTEFSNYLPKSDTDETSSGTIYVPFSLNDTLIDFGYTAASTNYTYKYNGQTVDVQPYQNVADAMYHEAVATFGNNDVSINDSNIDSFFEFYLTKNLTSIVSQFNRLSGISKLTTAGIYYTPTWFKLGVWYKSSDTEFFELNKFYTKEFGTVSPFVCTALDSLLLAENPKRALTKYITEVQDDCSLTFTENELIALSSGSSITITCPTNTINKYTLPVFTSDGDKIDLDNYEVSYIKNEDEGGTLGKLDIEECDWMGYSSLKLNTTENNGQRLFSNHSITLYDKDNSILGTYTGAMSNESAEPISNIRFQLKYNFENVIGDYLDVTTKLEATEKEELNSVYIYSLLSNPASSRYEFINSTNETYVNFKLNGESSIQPTVSIEKLSLKDGKYLIPINGYDDIKISMTYEIPIVLEDLTDTNISTNLETETTTIKLTAYSDNKDYFLGEKLHFAYLEIPETIPSGVDCKLNISVCAPSGQPLQNNKFETLKLIIDDIFKFENNPNIRDDEFENIRAKIRKLDKNNEYNYSHRINDDDIIEDPLLPKTYWEDNHVFNKYTIAQMSPDDLTYRFIN